MFTGSAAASGSGLGMLLAPVAEAGPARRLAAAGATEAGVASAKDPKYVVVPQREGLEAVGGERQPPA